VRYQGGANECASDDYAGEDAPAKRVVAQLINDSGFAPVDLGGWATVRSMEAPRRPGAVYGEEYRLAEARLRGARHGGALALCVRPALRRGDAQIRGNTTVGRHLRAMLAVTESGAGVFPPAVVRWSASATRPPATTGPLGHDATVLQWRDVEE
jgi:hypothetical protein